MSSPTRSLARVIVISFCNELLIRIKLTTFLRKTVKIPCSSLDLIRILVRVSRQRNSARPRAALLLHLLPKNNIARNRELPFVVERIGTENDLVFLRRAVARVLLTAGSVIIHRGERDRTIKEALEARKLAQKAHGVY